MTRFVRLSIPLAMFVSLAIFAASNASNPIASAQEVSPSGPNKPKGYSPEVEAKAEKILADVGLKRIGKRYTSDEISSLNRELSTLTRRRRDLKQTSTAWREATDQLAAINNQLRQLTFRHGQLSLQLAQVAGVDASANNRIVGLLNANTAEQKLLRERRDAVTAEVGRRRQTVNEEEASYTTDVLQLRKRADSLTETLTTKLADQNVQIAMKVMAANHDAAVPGDASSMLSSVEKRLQSVEQEVFREAIPLDDRGNSLYANVVVGDQTVSMVVDTGATLVVLPNDLAAKLGVQPGPGDPELILTLADGRSIPARGATVPVMRLGTFEAKDVDVAVLDPSAVAAEPLLGMSFLGSFRSELDPAAKTLRLTRVETE